MADKVLVTGGAGFIGHHVVNLFLEKNYDVVVIDNLSSGSKYNLHQDSKFIECDIRAELDDVFLKERFKYVIHLAAQPSAPNSISNPKYDCECNVIGTINILKASLKCDVEKVIYASTAAVYGDNKEIPLKEETLLIPTSFYGLSKLTSEHYLNLYKKIYGLDNVILRYANVYGPKQGASGEGGVVNIFINKIKNEDTLQIFGDGKQTRDFVYVSDVAQANYEAVCASSSIGKDNIICNVSTKVQTSVNELINNLMKISGKQVPVAYLESRQGDIYNSYLDNNRAQTVLGWSPKVSLYDGLSITYNS